MSVPAVGTKLKKNINTLLTMSTATVTLPGGATPRTITEAVDTWPDNAPDGVRNSAYPGQRYFILSPDDYTTAPTEKTLITYLGTDYFTLATATDPVSGILTCYCYRVPVQGTSSQDAAQKTKFGAS